MISFCAGKYLHYSFYIVYLDIYIHFVRVFFVEFFGGTFIGQLRTFLWFLKFFVLSHSLKPRKNWKWREKDLIIIISVIEGFPLGFPPTLNHSNHHKNSEIPSWRLPRPDLSVTNEAFIVSNIFSATHYIPRFELFKWKILLSIFSSILFNFTENIYQGEKYIELVKL